MWTQLATSPLRAQLAEGERARIRGEAASSGGQRPRTEAGRGLPKERGPPKVRGPPKALTENHSIERLEEIPGAGAGAAGDEVVAAVGAVDDRLAVVAALVLDASLAVG